MYLPLTSFYLRTVCQIHLRVMLCEFADSSHVTDTWQSRMYKNNAFIKLCRAVSIGRWVRAATLTSPLCMTWLLDVFKQELSSAWPYASRRALYIYISVWFARVTLVLRTSHTHSVVHTLFLVPCSWPCRWCLDHTRTPPALYVAWKKKTCFSSTGSLYRS